jgi:hypothetical protein
MANATDGSGWLVNDDAAHLTTRPFWMNNMDCFPKS